MQEERSPERYRAEISMLNHEIYELSQKLNESESLRLKAVSSDKYDPFGNPTDYPGFTGDYSKICPKVGQPGYSLPLEPDPEERLNLRKFYSIGGWCFLFQFVLANTGAMLLSTLISSLISGSGRLMSPAEASDYMHSSSITAGISMLVYMIFNVTVALFGMKWAGIRKSSLIHTKKFTAGKAVQYCLAALLIWVVMLYASTGIGLIFEKFGYTTKTISTAEMARTPLGFAVLTLYTSIIAPITEEFLFRGMLLRVFSKANQRFAVFATAFLFALSHKNIPQFLIAFGVGIFLAHITLIHGSIIPSIIVHIFINCFANIVQQFAQSDPGTKLVEELIIVAFALVGAVMLLAFMGSEKLPSTTPKQSRRGFPLASSSLGVMLSVVIPLAYSVYIFVSANR